MTNVKDRNFITLRYRIIHFCIILYVSVFFLPVFSAEQLDFKEIDAAVIGMRRARRVRKVIRFIKRHSRNDWERARGAYVWVANNIEYDVEAYHSEKKAEVDPKKVFSSGKSICMGYAGLFEKICQGLDLETGVINGYAKGYKYSEGMHFNKTNHSWNAVKIKNKWHFIETTWGAGALSPDGKKFIRKFSAAWFDTDPRLFVLNHFPEDTSWLLITPPMTLDDYEKWPHSKTYYIEAFYEAGFSVDDQLTLFTYLPFPKFFDQYTKSFSKMGGKASDLINFLKQGSVPSFWTYPGYYPELIDYPKTGILSSGKKYFFSFRLPRCKKAAVFSGDDFTYLKKKKDNFYGEAIVKPGEVRLLVKIKNKGDYGNWPLAIWQCK